MDINIWAPSTIATIVGFILVLIGALKKNSSSRKTLFMFGLPVLGAGLIVLFASASLPDSLQFLNNPLWGGLGQSTTIGGNVITYSAGAGTGASGASNVICTVEDTTVTLSGQNKYTSLASGGTHRYRLNGAPALTVADAGTFTASPGDKVEVLWGNGTTTGNFGVVETYEVPCLGTKTFNAFTVNNGTLTTRVFNEEGNLIDTSGENETLGAGDVVNLNWEIQGTYQTAFPYGLVLIIEYNSSAIDDIVPKLNNVVLSTTNIPISYSGTSYGGTSGKKAYLVPPAWSNDKLTGTLMIDTDDTNNPGDTTNGDIIFTYNPLNYFINEDKGGAFDGPSAEDEDNALTRSSGGGITYTLSVD